jgi:hypothetical protein
VYKKYLRRVITPDDNRTHSLTLLERNSWKNPYTQGGPFKPAELIPNVDMQEHVDEYLDHRVAKQIDEAQNVPTLVAIGKLTYRRTDLNNTCLNSTRRIVQKVAGNLPSFASQIVDLDVASKKLLYRILTERGGEDGRKVLLACLEGNNIQLANSLLPDNLGDLFIDLQISDLLQNPITENVGIDLVHRALRQRCSHLLDQGNFEQLGKVLQGIVDRRFKQDAFEVMNKELQKFTSSNIVKKRSELMGLLLLLRFLEDWTDHFTLLKENTREVLDILNSQFDSFLPQLCALNFPNRTALYKLLVLIDNSAGRILLLKCAEACEKHREIQEIFNKEALGLFSDFRMQGMHESESTFNLCLQLMLAAKRNLDVNLANPYAQYHGLENTIELLQNLYSISNDEQVMHGFINTLNYGFPHHILKRSQSSIEIRLLLMENWITKQKVAKMEQIISGQATQIASLRSVQNRVDKQADEIALLSQRQAQQLSHIRSLQQGGYDQPATAIARYPSDHHWATPSSSHTHRQSASPVSKTSPSWDPKQIGFVHTDLLPPTHHSTYYVPEDQQQVYPPHVHVHAQQRSPSFGNNGVDHSLGRVIYEHQKK